MRIVSHANRGTAWEQLIELANQQYRGLGLAFINKVPTPFIPIRGRSGKVVNVKVEQKSIVDYVGRYKSRPLAAEAKHTIGRRIPFAAVKPHQAFYLDNWCRGRSGEGLVLLSFKLKRFFAVPWPFWRAGIDGWELKRQIKMTYARWTWTTPGKASVSPEELLPDWEIKLGGQAWLPYLQTLEKMEV